MLNDGVEVNPATAVSVPKNLAKTRREPPPADILEKIKASHEIKFGLFAFLILHTGCRRGEALALQYKDFDFENKQINIDKSVYYVSDSPFIKKPKTKAGVRKVPLLEALEKLVPKMKPDDYIFGYEGELLHNKHCCTLWKNYCKTIGANELTLHQLRHAYTTRLYELNIDEKSAQDILGHADISTTRNIYTHISNEKRKITAEQLRDF